MSRVLRDSMESSSLSPRARFLRKEVKVSGSED